VITTTLDTDNGKLVLPHGQAYRILVLPDRADISLDVLKRLEKLISNGAVVIGRKPERTTSLKNYPEADREVKEISDKIWGDCDGQRIFSNKYGKGTIYWGKSAHEVLEELAVYPDFEVKGIDNHDLRLDFFHRKTAHEDIYFVSNSSQNKEKITGVFRVDPNLKPEIWDAETGLIQRDVKFTKVKNGLEIDMVMDPLASRFVIFRKKSSGSNDANLYHNLQFGFEENPKANTVSVIDISADWNIGFLPDGGGPKSLQLGNLVSWSDMEEEGARFYSGAATYTRDFMINKETLSSGKEAFVSFEDIQEMAQVFVNGNDCGVVWLPPYAARITPYLKEGKNTITVKVINTWNNRIVGDIRNPDKAPFTRTNARIRFNKNTPLLQSGLIGKAQIRFETK
jgi:hypothetical protein